MDRVRVSDYAQNQAALQGLADMVAAGKLTLRVAETVPPEYAGEAQRGWTAAACAAGSSSSSDRGCIQSDRTGRG